MKITHVTTRALRTPADNPLVVGLPAPTDMREFVTLELGTCLLYTSPSPRDRQKYRMPSSA